MGTPLRRSRPIAVLVSVALLATALAVVVAVVNRKRSAAEADTEPVRPTEATAPAPAVAAQPGSVGTAELHEQEPTRPARPGRDAVPLGAVDVEIGNERITVQMHRAVIAEPPYTPVGRLLDQYEALAQRARDGDGPAARMLHNQLRVCRLLRDHEARRSRPVEDDPDTAESLRYCEGLSERHFADTREWARIAAESGDFLGRRDWASQLREDGEIQASLDAWEALWSDGHTSALTALSLLYRSGVPANGGQPDYLRAYAYALVAWRLQEAISGEGTPARRARLMATEDQQRYLGGMLTPQQQAEAEQLAIRLLAENANCCIRP